MFGYIDLTPHRLRRLADRLGKRDPDFDLLLSAAEAIEHHDELIDGLASAEREKLQQEMADLRARIAVLSRTPIDAH